jgi:hypothetical protein
MIYIFYSSGLITIAAGNLSKEDIINWHHPDIVAIGVRCRKPFITRSS